MSNATLDILDAIAGACVAMVLTFIALRVLQWVAVNLFKLVLRAFNAVAKFINVAERRIARETEAALLLVFRLTCLIARMALSAVTRPLWTRLAPKIDAVREQVKRWIADLDRASRGREEPRAERARKAAPRPPRSDFEEAFKLTLQTIEKAKRRR